MFNVHVIIYTATTVYTWYQSPARKMCYLFGMQADQLLLLLLTLFVSMCLCVALAASVYALSLCAPYAIILRITFTHVCLCILCVVHPLQTAQNGTTANPNIHKQILVASICRRVLQIWHGLCPLNMEWGCCALIEHQRLQHQLQNQQHTTDSTHRISQIDKYDMFI